MSGSEISGDLGANTLPGGPAGDTIYGDSLIGDSILAATFEDGAGDSIDGDDGNDLIFGQGGDDTALGGLGDDTLSGGVGSDVLDGGAGNDIADYSANTAGQPVNISATGADDGSGGFDSFTDIEGVIGGEGNDNINFTGYTGVAATLSGGGGDDAIIGDSAAFASGGLGADIINFDTSSVAGTMSGGDGDDQIYGGSAGGAASGDAGSDFLFFLNADSLSGVTLDGGDGDDNLLGGAGNDSLNGGADNDSLYGGLGNDTLDGDTGADTVTYEALGSTGVNVSVNGGDDGAGGTDSFAGIEAVIGTTEADTIDFGAATTDVTLDGGAGNDLLTGGDGNDLLLVGTGSETLVGGDGADTASYARLNDTLDLTVGGGVDGFGDIDSFDGIEAVEAGSGNDRIDFSAAGFDATLAGGEGADTLTGGIGNDSLVGGNDDDTLTGGAGDDVLDGGDWDDTVSYAGVSGAVTLDTTGGSDGQGGNDDFISIEAVEGGSGSDSIDFGSAAFDASLTGGAGDDTLIGGVFDDRLTGGAGNDSLVGGDGLDIASYRGSGSGVTLDVTGGEDGNGGTDSFEGIEGVLGSAGNDSIDFGAATFDADLRGGLGNDTLIGGWGDDTISARGTVVADGGDGDDFLSFQTGAGEVTASGGAGNDELLIGYSGGSLSGGSGDDTLLGFNIDIGEPFYAGATLDGGAGNDDISDGFGNDSLVGGDDDDFILAFIGENTLDGGEGNDELYGGLDNDSLVGGDGDDYMAELDGDNTLDGGAGFDFAGFDALGDMVFSVDGGSIGGFGQQSLIGIEGVGGGLGNDLIDFGTATFDAVLIGSIGDDTLAGGTGNDLLIGETGSDNLVGGDGADTADYFFSIDDLFLTTTGGDDGYLGADTFDGIEAVQGGEGFDTIDFSAAAFDATLAGDLGDDSLTGGTGNDSLEGGVGADTLAGGDGADTLVSGNTNDLVLGGADNDVLVFSGGGNTVDAGADDDLITGALGGGVFNADSIDGGDGNDTLSFTQAGYYRITDIGEPGGEYEVGFLGADTTPPAQFYGTFRNIERFTYEGGLFDIASLNEGVTLFVCFATGTRILTEAGEVPVEDLQAGDVVATLGLKGPVRRRVLWVGKRRVTLAGHPNAASLAPIRIRAGALGEGAPVRDLLVSGDHCLYLDGALVPARLLVDGVGIVREQGWAEVTWWHVELDAHDVLIADGAAAESWLDAGNRAWFANAPTALLRVEGTPDAYAASAPEPCAPVIHGGPRLATIRDAIALRAWDAIALRACDAIALRAGDEIALRAGDEIALRAARRSA